MKISLFNPFSKNFNAVQEFNQLTSKQRAYIAVMTALAALASLPFLGIGGVAVFRHLSHKLKTESEQKTHQFAINLLNSESIQAENVENLDLIENDGNPSTVNILDQLVHLKNNTFTTSKTMELDHGQKDATELVQGQAMIDQGNLKCGNFQLPFASVRRAAEQPNFNKVIEDQLIYVSQTYQLNTDSLDTVFIVSNDGNKNNKMALFYSSHAPAIFELKLQEYLTTHSSPMINLGIIQQLLKETHETIQKDWEEHVKNNPQDLGSGTTVNMIFLYPSDEDHIQGAFFGLGDTRTIIMKAQDRTVVRIGSLDKASQAQFVLNRGDKMFVSSDGIWHNASPSQVNQFLHERLNDYQEAETPAFQLKEALFDLVRATLPGREDDRNPFLLTFPA